MKNYFKIITVVLCLTVYISPAIMCAESDEHKKNLLYLEDRRKAEASTVLLNNSKGILPLKYPEKGKIASINIDSEYAVQFNDTLKRYTPVTAISFPQGSLSAKNIKALSKKIKSFKTVIIQTTDRPLADSAVIKFITECRKRQNVILYVTGNSTVLKNLDRFTQPVIISDTASETSAAYAAQVIAGGAGISSKLETAVTDKYHAGAGDSTIPVRLKYTVPEETGINSEDLMPIDEIVKEAIDNKATPGAVVMVVKDGMVIFEKSYGFHTYDGVNPVKTDDIYDLASITKAAAATIAVMRLHEQGRIGLDNPVSSYLSETRRTNKKKITVRDLMLHQAGLAPSLEFSRKLKPSDYRRRYSAAYSVKASDNFYLRKGYYKNSMWPQILKSHLGIAGQYLYSDLSMFFIKELIERQSRRKFQDYLYSNFYSPLGMQTAMFNPRDKFSKDRIVPTEVDTYLRKTTLHGYVHDQGAALTGGVAGHAGLFSSANDLAVLFQMLLNRGNYGGIEFFKGETVDLFTSKPSETSRRTLGFDGWDPKSETGFPSSLAPHSVYGHTGFTGTCVWADPDNNLIFIFLSNRTYPNTPNKLAKMNIRSRILDAIYTAVENSK